MQTNQLFQPFELGRLKLRNRIAMAPMTRSFSPGNVPNEDNIAYYERRALNQVGLIITEGTYIDFRGASGYPDVPHFYGEKGLAGWKEVADAVHDAGGAIFPQLWHVGSVRRPDKLADSETPAYSPSGLFKPGRENGNAMTRSDIEDAVAGYAASAQAAKEIGFDGVELHGAHGYLIDQFFWDGTNKRTDGYGGGLVERTRFGVEVVQAVRAAVGPDFPICLRYSQWKLQNYDVKLAEDPNQLAAFLEPLVAAGVDIFHCSTRRFWEPEFEGSDLNLAGWTKKLTGVPTITVGSVGLTSGFIDEGGGGMSDLTGKDLATLENLNSRMEAGEFDLVAVGRALLQDPEWVLKVKEGRYDELQDYAKEAQKVLY